MLASIFYIAKRLQNADKPHTIPNSSSHQAPPSHNNNTMFFQENSNGRQSRKRRGNGSSSSRSWTEPPLVDALNSLDQVYQDKKTRFFSKTTRNGLALLLMVTFACVACTGLTNNQQDSGSSGGSGSGSGNSNLNPNTPSLGDVNQKAMALAQNIQDWIPRRLQPRLMGRLRRQVSDTSTTTRTQFTLFKDSVDEVSYYYTIPSPTAATEDARDDAPTQDSAQEANSSSNIQGILFLAHGCGGSASLYFAKDDPAQRLASNDICRHRKACVGAPEHRAIVDLAHERGMMVVAASSWDRKSQCWRNRDGARIAAVLREVQEKVQETRPTNDKNKNLPVYVFGSSSGGELAGWYLPSNYRKALAQQSSKRINTANATATNAKKPSDSVETQQQERFDGYIMMNKVPREQYEKDLPAVYIKMPNDAKTAKAIDEFAQHQSTGPTKQIDLPPYQLSETFFADRIPDVAPAQSRQIYRELVRANLLTDDGRTLQAAPSKHNAVIGHLLSTKCGMEDHRNVFDVLSVAYGHHATTRDGVGEALDWLLEQTKQNGLRNSIVLPTGSTSGSTSSTKETKEKAAPKTLSNKSKPAATAVKQATTVKQTAAAVKQTPTKKQTAAAKATTVKQTGTKTQTAKKTQTAAKKKQTSTKTQAASSEKQTAAKKEKAAPPKSAPSKSTTNSKDKPKTVDAIKR